MPEFDEVAFAVKTNTVAKPVETPEYGWFVVKATSARSRTPTEKTEATTIRQTLLQQEQNTAMTAWASNLAKKICTGGKITYQIGYTPKPDPCAQYTTPADDDRVVALADALVELQELTERLRRECPWDREQTERTIVPHTVEEAYEVADAALAGDDAKLLDELGDLLFQTYFLALLLSERGAGDLEASRARSTRSSSRATRTSSATPRRDTAGRVRENWERLKVEQEAREGVFHDVPETLPALLLRAARCSGARPSVGFDYPDVAGPLDELDEELRELRGGARVRRRARARERARPARRGRARRRAVRGVNVARRLNVDPELELRAATQRFVERVETAQAPRGGRAARTGASSTSPSRIATTSGRRSVCDESDRDPSTAARCSTRAATRRSRSTSGSSPARSAAPPFRRAPRPACTRRSSCATAAPAWGGKGVAQAVANVNGEIAARGRRPRRGATRRRSTRALIELDGTPNKGRLGANAILGVSLAAAKARAAEDGRLALPLASAATRRARCRCR